MKNLITILFVQLVFLTSIYSQEQKAQFTDLKEPQVFLEANGEHRPNLLLLDFFRKDSRFINGTEFSSNGIFGSAYGNTAAMMRTNSSYLYYNNPGNSNFTFENANVSFTPTNRTFLYIDGELIFGNGESRLDKIINVRMKDVKTIARFNDFDTKIFVTLINNDEVRY